jgi:hypothetical protein
VIKKNQESLLKGTAAPDFRWATNVMDIGEEPLVFFFVNLPFKKFPQPCYKKLAFLPVTSFYVPHVSPFKKEANTTLTPVNMVLEVLAC